MGGLSLAAKQLGLHVAAAVDTAGTALKTFGRNFPNAVTIEGTIGGSKAMESCVEALRPYPRAPLIIVSGPPCQGFSAAGTRDPSDKRNKVFLAVARAITALQPACALVENVATLLSDKHSSRLADFEAHLRLAGYSVIPRLLNAKDFGVAQKRTRAFFLITRQPVDAASLDQRLNQLKQPTITVAEALNGLPMAETESYIRQRCGSCGHG